MYCNFDKKAISIVLGKKVKVICSIVIRRNFVALTGFIYLDGHAGTDVLGQVVFEAKVSDREISIGI